MYEGLNAEDLATYMARNGYTQEGVNRLYELRGLGQAPTLPAGFEGVRSLPSRGARLYEDANGRRVRGTGEFANFLNTYNSQAVDPWNEWGVGNYLGLAGLLVGGGAALSGVGGAGAVGTGTGTGSGLGIFSNGGAAGLAGVGGGNAGALAASGALGGGAAISGATGGALGLGGGSMGLWDNLLDLAPLVGSLYNSGQQRSAAGDAARAEQAGIREAIAEQRRQFDTSLELLRPQREFGNNALNELSGVFGYGSPQTGSGAIGSTGIGVNGAGGVTQGVQPGSGATAAGAPMQPGNYANFFASPDYQFRRDEGNRDINNSFAARGGALSGNALRGITDFNSNLASGEFNNFVQRRLQAAGLGGAATSQSVNAGNYTSGNVSNLLQSGGNARASGIINQSNAVTGGLNDIGGWYGNWLQNRRGG